MATGKDREIKDPDVRLELLEDQHGKLEERFDEFCDHVDEGFTEVYSRIDKGNRDIAQQIRLSAAEQNEVKRFKWSTASVVAGGIVFAVWTVFTMAINLYIQPLISENALRKAENAGSADDRNHLNVSVSLIEKNMAYLQSDVAKEQSERRMAEKEVETQLRAEEELHNTQWAEQQRMNANLWNSGPLGKVTPYTGTPAYFPHIATPKND